MDKRAKDEILETLKLYKVKAGDREECMEYLICAFNAFRRRSYARSKLRREIEAEIRNTPVKCVGSEDEYIIFHSGGEWADNLVAASPAQARAFVGAYGCKDLKNIAAWKKLLQDFPPA